MPKTTNRLSAVKAQSLKKPGMHADGLGLYLRVKTSGARSWVLRYSLNGRARYFGLGSLPSVSPGSRAPAPPRPVSSCATELIRSTPESAPPPKPALLIRRS